MRRNSWHFNKTTPSFPSSKRAFSFCFCALLQQTLSWRAFLRGLVTGFPFQLTLPPSRFMHVWHNLQTLSVPITTGYKSPSQQPPHHPRNVFTLPPLRGKRLTLTTSPPLKCKITPNLSPAHTCFQKSVFPPLMVLYHSSSYSTTQDTQITVKFTVRQHKHVFISLSMHGFMNMNIQMFKWIFTKYRSVSKPLLFSSFFSRTHTNHMHKHRRAGCLLLEFSNNYNQLFQQRSAAVPSMHQHLVFATLYVLGLEMSLIISTVLISFCSDCRWAPKFSCLKKQIF